MTCITVGRVCMGWWIGVYLPKMGRRWTEWQWQRRALRRNSPCHPTLARCALQLPQASFCLRTSYVCSLLCLTHLVNYAIASTWCRICSSVVCVVLVHLSYPLFSDPWCRFTTVRMLEREILHVCPARAVFILHLRVVCVDFVCLRTRIICLLLRLTCLLVNKQQYRDWVVSLKPFRKRTGMCEKCSASYAVFSKLCACW